MKFKMAENSLFATLLRSPWWVSLTLAVAARRWKSAHTGLEPVRALQLRGLQP
jgi:hypothetical protein